MAGPGVVRLDETEVRRDADADKATEETDELEPRRERA